MHCDMTSMMRSQRKFHCSPDATDTAEDLQQWPYQEKSRNILAKHPDMATIGNQILGYS